MTREDIRRQATWIMCPWCDEPVCTYHGVNCPEIEAFIDRKMKEFAEAMDKKTTDAILG